MGETAGSGTEGSSARRPLIPPEVLDSLPEARVGKYVRTEKLGSGAMGEVWKAWDSELLRWVALKFLRNQDPDDLARFRREARLAARLTHPGIAAVYEIGEVSGRPFIAMQFIEGRTLKDAGRLDARTLVQLIRQAAEAAGFAHDEGVIHRDLKPDNLMVRKRGEELQTVIMDFGLARAVDGGGIEISRSGWIFGTPAYMSPEQARGTPLDGRSDVWSLGVTLFEGLSGKRPFEGAEVLAILQSIQTEEPPPMKGIDPDLQAVVLKCLQKEPRYRYASARELAEDLGRWLDGAPVEARNPSTIQQLIRGIRRRSGLWLAGAAVLLIAAAALAWALTRGDRDPVRLKEAEERLALSERARGLQAAYYELSLKTVVSLRKLEDHWWGRRLPGEELDRALREVETAADGVAARFPGTALPLAWKGFAGFLAGRPNSHRQLLSAADQQTDPLSALLLIRANLLEYLSGAEPIAIDCRSGVVVCGPRKLDHPALTEAMLKSLSSSPLWALLDQARELQEYGRAARSFADQDYETAARRLDSLRGHPELGAETGFLDAYCRLYGGDHAAALKALDAAVARGWPRAIVLAARCEVLSITSGRIPVPAHGEAFGRSSRLLDRLLEIDPRNEMALADRICLQILQEEHRPVRSRESASRLQDTLTLADRLLQAHPRSRTFRTYRAILLTQLALNAAGRGEDPLVLFDQALACIDPADLAGGEVLETAHSLGMARIGRASYLQERGSDPTADCNAAIEAFTTAARTPTPNTLLGRAKALSIKAQATNPAEGARLLDLALSDAREAARLAPDPFDACQAMAILSWTRAAYAEASGEDPFPWFDRAIQAADDALKARPEDPEGHKNRGIAGALQGEAAMRRGKDGRPFLDRALSSFGEALRLAPDTPDYLAGRAKLLLTRARASGARGAAPMPDLDRALEDADQALRLQPGLLQCRLTRAAIRGLRALRIMDSGLDPSSEFEQAFADYDEVVRSAPRMVDGRRQRLHRLLDFAQWKHARRLDASHECARMIEDATVVLELRPDEPDAFDCRAIAHQIRSESALAGGRDPRPEARLAIADFDRYLKHSPGSVPHLNQRGRARLMMATASEASERTTAAREALADFDAGLAISSDPWALHLGRGQALECLDRVSEAIEAYEACLARNPSHAWARGRIALLRSRSR